MTMFLPSRIADKVYSSKRCCKLPGWFGWARTSDVTATGRHQKYLVVNEIQSNGLKILKLVMIFSNPGRTSFLGNTFECSVHDSR